MSRRLYVKKSKLTANLNICGFNLRLFLRNFGLSSYSFRSILILNCFCSAVQLVLLSWKPYYPCFTFEYCTPRRSKKIIVISQTPNDCKKARRFSNKLLNKLKRKSLGQIKCKCSLTGYFNLFQTFFL